MINIPQKTVLLLSWNCEFWFEITVNKIRSNFQTFISFTLYLEKTLKLNLLGKKKLFKTFVPYFISFSVIYSFYGFFESRARRTIFQIFFSKMFPCFLTFRCLLCILLHICRLHLNSLDEAAQFMIIKAGKALVPLTVTWLF